MRVKIYENTGETLELTVEYDTVEQEGLSDEQLWQQDFVDNAILSFLQDLAGHSVEYGIEMIGSIRDAIIPVLLRHEIIESEYEFYPWVKE